jgi:hypothetical protein
MSEQAPDVALHADASAADASATAAAIKARDAR